MILVRGSLLPVRQIHAPRSPRLHRCNLQPRHRLEVRGCDDVCRDCQYISYRGFGTAGTD